MSAGEEYTIAPAETRDALDDLAGVLSGFEQTVSAFGGTPTPSSAYGGIGAQAAAAGDRLHSETAGSLVELAGSLGELRSRIRQAADAYDRRDVDVAESLKALLPAAEHPLYTGPAAAGSTGSASPTGGRP